MYPYSIVLVVREQLSFKCPALLSQSAEDKLAE